MLIVLALVAHSCSQKQQEKPEVTRKDELVVFLDSLERAYEAACFRMGTANWNSYSKEGSYDLNGAKAGFAKIFLDTTARKTIEEWRGKSNSLADKLLTRRLEIWHRCFIGGTIYAGPDVAKMENDLQERITNFKFAFEGTPTTRAKVSNGLRQEKNQTKRHKLWSVTSQVSATTSTDLIKLVKLRNERAKALGFLNYYSLSLHLQAIDEQWLIRTLNLLEEKTHDAFEEFIALSKKKLRVKEFGPWDFDLALREAASLPDKYFPPDSVFNIIHEFQKGIGFPVDSLPIKEVVKDIPYGGLSLALTIPTDSRFLVNPTKGKGFYSVAFHEYGHSLKAVHTQVEYPILKGYEWIPGAQCAAYEEGVADMHGEFTDDSLWLTMFTEAKPKEIEKYIKGRGIPTLYRVRRLLKDFFIEYEMYKHPEQDMAEVERAMFKKYLLVGLDESEPHQFAASIWYTSYPCYYQNYILAGMIATQLQEAMTSKFGEEKVTNPKVSLWMIHNLYATGETEEWNERIRNATGKSLETGAYLRKLGIETSHAITKEDE
jgi:peptidyl-dipeptidase A